MSLANFIDYIRGKGQRNTASVAKNRLQIIVSHERGQRSGPDFLPMLKQELLTVIAKYVEVDVDQVKVELAKTGDCSILELNIVLPEPKGPKA